MHISYCWRVTSSEYIPMVNSGLGASSGGNATIWLSRINGPTCSQTFFRPTHARNFGTSSQAITCTYFPLGPVHMKPMPWQISYIVPTDKYNQSIHHSHIYRKSSINSFRSKNASIVGQKSWENISVAIRNHLLYIKNAPQKALILCKTLPFILHNWLCHDFSHCTQRIVISHIHSIVATLYSNCNLVSNYSDWPHSHTMVSAMSCR